MWGSYRDGFTPTISRTWSAILLCRFQCSTAIATSSPPIKSMLESFRYWIQTWVRKNKYPHGRAQSTIHSHLRHQLKTCIWQTFWITSLDSMMPIMGKRMTGSKAVTARGIHSVHQYSAIRIIAKPHFASYNDRQWQWLIHMTMSHQDKEEGKNYKNGSETD